jgi:carbon-monoxide dehydrogenase medium subunit
MLLPSFDYKRPKSVVEAVRLVAKDPGAQLLAGGTDLLPQCRLGRRKPKTLVDLKGIAELAKIRTGQDGGLRIGACVPLGEIAAWPAVKKDYPLLAECCLAVGAYPLRFRATLAGNVCNASPAADTAVALLCLDASFEVAGTRGKRTIQAKNFFKGPGKTALKRGEILTEIQLPGSARGIQGRYLRLSRRQGMDLATVGVLVGRGGPGLKPRHRLALGAVYPTPVRVAKAEQLLDSEGPAAVGRAAELARAFCCPIDDVRGSASYRREMVKVLTLRGLQALGAP